VPASAATLLLLIISAGSRPSNSSTAQTTNAIAPLMEATAKNHVIEVILALLAAFFGEWNLVLTASSCACTACKLLQHQSSVREPR
jgi:hypothetical protein